MSKTAENEGARLETRGIDRGMLNSPAPISESVLASLPSYDTAAPSGG